LWFPTGSCQPFQPTGIRSILLQRSWTVEPRVCSRLVVPHWPIPRVAGPKVRPAPARRGTIWQVTSRTAAAQHLRDTRRIERAMALRRRGDLSVAEVCFASAARRWAPFSSRFTELVAKQVTEPIRNREARVTGPHLA